MHFAAVGKGGAREKQEDACPLTPKGGLGRPARISIGRNMAGPHCFPDHSDSLRSGEAMTLEMLEEQALCCQTVAVVMSVSTFDGGLVRMGSCWRSSVARHARRATGHRKRCSRFGAMIRKALSRNATCRQM